MSAQGQSASSAQSSKPIYLSRMDNHQQNNIPRIAKTKPQAAVCQPKSCMPPSLEKADKPKKRLNLESNNMEVDPQAENHTVVQENLNITSSNESSDATRQTVTMDQNSPVDETRSNNMVTLATGSNTGEISETNRRNNNNNNYYYYYMTLSINICTLYLILNTDALY